MYSRGPVASAIPLKLLPEVNNPMRFRVTLVMLLGLLLAGRTTVEAEPPEKEPADRTTVEAESPKEKPAGEKRSARKKANKTFLRLVRDKKKGPIALEAAIVRYVLQDGGKKTTVDLVSAVHVAEKSYYDQLNREFAKYDAVLYELVAPKGTRIPKGGLPSGGSPISMLQSGMTEMLELEFQLEEIDYTRKNMVHADMSPTQFSESMQRRGESVFTMFLRMMGYAMARQSSGEGGSTDMQLLMALFDKNRALALKRAMAEQFEDMEGTLGALDGPDGSTIISERNKVALSVLRKQIDSGKRKLAVFYGAGHMPDLEKRLRDDFGLERKKTRWLVAWDLKDEP